MTTIRKIGLDPGFSSLKVAEVQGDDITACLLPAAVGLNANTNSGLSLGRFGAGSRRGAKPQTVTFEGYEYLVGHNVARYTAPIHVMDFDRFSNSPELRASLYAALHQLLNGGGHNIALAVALPVNVLQDKSEADRVERGIKRWLVGEHVFAVNGVDARVNVVDVRARIPQPVASWMDWGLGLDGQWTKGKTAALADTLVIDQGFNTLDVLVVKGGQISSRLSGGDTLGMRQAAERLSEALYRRFRLRLDLLEANALIWRVTKGQRAGVSLYGAQEDVTGQVKQIIRSLEVDVVRFLEGILRQGAAYHTILTGGGALSMARKLLELFPEATLLHEPVLANARGLARMAQRPGFLGTVD